jgi:hypothetical protein
MCSFATGSAPDAVNGSKLFGPGLVGARLEVAKTQLKKGSKWLQNGISKNITEKGFQQAEFGS